MSIDCSYKREINIFGNIGESLATRVISELSDIFELDRKVIEYNEKFMRDYNTTVPPYKLEPLRINIMSYGGSIDSMFAIADYLDESPSAIHTHCIGYAMSASFYIYLLGDIRSSGKNATFMMHKAMGGVDGTMIECRSRLDMMSDSEELMFDDIINRTKLSRDDVDKCKLSNRYIRYDEAVKLDIINHDTYYSEGSLDTVVNNLGEVESTPDNLEFL